MMRLFTLLAFVMGVNFAPMPVFAQSGETIVDRLPVATAIRQAKNNPNYCINSMAEFPTDDHETRYQFFRLTEEMARDMMPNMQIGELQQTVPCSMQSKILLTRFCAKPLLK